MPPNLSPPFGGHAETDDSDCESSGSEGLDQAPLLFEESYVSPERLQAAKVEAHEILALPPQASLGREIDYSEAVPVEFGSAYIQDGMPKTGKVNLPFDSRFDTDTYESEEACEHIAQVVFFRYCAIHTWSLRTLLPTEDLLIRKPNDKAFKSSLLRDGRTHLYRAISACERVVALRVVEMSDGMTGEERERLWRDISDDEVLDCWKHLEPGVAIHTLVRDTPEAVWAKWLRQLTVWLAELTYQVCFIEKSFPGIRDYVKSFELMFYGEEWEQYPKGVATIPSYAPFLSRESRE